MPPPPIGPTISGNNTSMKGFEADTVTFGPKEINIWRPNTISTLTGGVLGGILVSQVIVSGVFNVFDNGGISLTLQGDWNEGLTQNNSPAYVLPNEVEVTWKTNSGGRGHADLKRVEIDNPLVMATRDTNISNGDFTQYYISGSQNLPAFSDCYSMDLIVDFQVYEPYSHYNNIEEGSAYLRREDRKIIIPIKNGHPAFFPR